MVIQREDLQKIAVTYQTNKGLPLVGTLKCSVNIDFREYHLLHISHKHRVSYYHGCMHVVI